jgi:NADH-quinone oxidoreductase subunit N
MAVLLFSLSGLPPTGGFWGKFNLFLAAWSTGSQPLRWLAVALAVNAAIAGWYYLRLVRRMYLHAVPETGATSADSGPLMAAVVGGCALAMLALFFLPNGLWRMVALAAAGPVAV